MAFFQHGVHLRHVGDGGGDRVATKLQSSVMDELGRKSVSLLNKSMTTSN
jgi:hypothetical protein